MASRYFVDYNADNARKVFVGAVPIDYDKGEFDREVQRWGDVCGTFFYEGKGWGTVTFRTIEIKDAFMKDKSR